MKERFKKAIVTIDALNYSDELTIYKAEELFKTLISMLNTDIIDGREWREIQDMIIEWLSLKKLLTMYCEKYCNIN